MHPKRHKRAKNYQLFIKMTIKLELNKDTSQSEDH